MILNEYSTRLGTALPVLLRCPWILGLYNAFHFPLRFPWVCRVPGFWASTAIPTSHCVSHGFSSGPGFRASTRVPTFHKVPPGFPVTPDSGPLHWFPLLCTPFPVILQSPRILGLYNCFHFSTAFRMVLQCARILGLYNGFLFPRCFPWVCSVPGFWASTKASSFQGVSRGFAVSPVSGPLQRFPLVHSVSQGF